VGAEPVFVDVREGDLTIDASRVAEAVDRQGVDVIMPVHEFGFPAQIDQIAMHSSLAGIPILEDAACALGTDSVPIIGTFGTLWCYSLHPRKVLTSGEGGLICTNDDSLAARLRLLRNHGLSWSDRGLDCVLPGTNARMTELQAVLALAQTQRLAAVVQRRREIAHRYSERLSVLSITLPPVDMIDSLNWQTYLVRFSSNEAREFAAERLRMAGIESSVGAQCIPAMSWYRARIGASEPSEAFPVSWNAWSRGLALPLHEGMSDDDVDRVIGVLQRVGVAA
jgi:dTDP-4-amino-4,6-dideoxygalactose transaminase